MLTDLIVCELEEDCVERSPELDQSAQETGSFLLTWVT